MLETTTHQWFITVSQVWYSDIGEGAESPLTGKLNRLPPGKFERILKVRREMRTIAATAFLEGIATDDPDVLNQMWSKEFSTWFWAGRKAEDRPPFSYLAQREWEGQIWFSWVPRSCCVLKEVDLMEV